MPYSSVADIPQSVKDRIKSPKKRRQWLHVWNSSYASHGDEGRAFASANSAVKKAVGMTDQESKFSFFLPLVKVDKEKRTISGYASTECVDLDGEIVSREAIKAALPGYMTWRNIREMHQPSAVGVAKEANIDEKGLYLTAKIVDDAAWKKVEEGVYKGFSIGGRKLAKVGNTITKVDLVEVSVVDRPANPECAITVQKNAKIDGAEAYLLPAPATSRDREALKKMAQVVDILADEPEAPVAEPAVKLSKAERKAAKKAAAAAVVQSASAPPSKAPDAGGGAEAARGTTESSHELSLEGASPGPLLEGGDLALTKRERKLLKRMGAAASLSYCFDSIRSAQRSLMIEAKQEGGDRRDEALAQKLGSIAQSLAGVIGQKAAHEGEEALSLTDADDVGMMSILQEGPLAMTIETNRNQPDDLSKMILGLVKKAAAGDDEAAKAAANSVGGILKAAEDKMKDAKKLRRAAEDCVKTAFEMCKADFVAKQALVKAGKKDGDTNFDHGAVMKSLQKAFGALRGQKDVSKAAGSLIAKAARVASEGTVEDPVPGVYKVPDGVTTLSPNEMDNLKANKAGFVSRTEAEALAKAAAAEAEANLLKSMPAGGAKPYAFDVTKVGLVAGQSTNPVAEFFKGANPANLQSDNATLREGEIAKSIGEKILGGGGKMIFDPAFHGTAGAS